MKKIDVGRTLHTLANLGVIVGIVFLAVELNQNNQLLRNEARYNLQLSRSGELDDLWRNPELSDLMAKAREGGALTDGEQRRLRSFILSRFVRWEWYYEQYREGFVEQSNLPVEAWRIMLANNPWATKYFDEYKRVFSPDFVRFVEDQVLGQ